MTDWNCEIEIFAHSTEEGRDKDLAAIGGQRIIGFRVQGESIYEALRGAENICTGIKLNPRVWQTHTINLHRVKRE